MCHEARIEKVESGHTKWHRLIDLLRECIAEEAEIKAKEILSKSKPKEYILKAVLDGNG